MIEFNGKLTGNAKKFFYKKTVCMAIFVMLIGSFIGMMTTIIAWYFYFSIFDFYYILAGICVVATLSLLPCAMFFSKKIITQKVTITEKLIYSKTGFRTKKILKSDVKKVYDYGEYYYIVANFLNHSSIFVCQKDLLSKGTLKDFEMLFSGKIKEHKGTVSCLLGKA